MLYIISLWLIYYLPGGLYLFAQPPSAHGLLVFTLFLSYLWVCFHFVFFVLFLDSTYKLDHKYLSFSFCLISLSIVPSGSIHVVKNSKISFFVIVVCTSHIFSTSPVNTSVASVSWLLWTVLQWTLGYLYLFPLVFSFSLCKYLGMELQDHVVVLFSIFWGPFKLFSIAAAPNYIPTHHVWGSPFLHILTNTCYFLSFWWWPF